MRSLRIRDSEQRWLKNDMLGGYYAHTGGACLRHARRLAATRWHLRLPARQTELRVVWLLPAPGGRANMSFLDIQPA